MCVIVSSPCTGQESNDRLATKRDGHSVRAFHIDFTQFSANNAAATAKISSLVYKLTVAL